MINALRAKKVCTVAPMYVLLADFFLLCKSVELTQHNLVPEKPRNGNTSL